MLNKLKLILIFIFSSIHFSIPIYIAYQVLGNSYQLYLVAFGWASMGLLHVALEMELVKINSNLNVKRLIQIYAIFCGIINLIWTIHFFLPDHIAAIRTALEIFFLLTDVFISFAIINVAKNLESK